MYRALLTVLPGDFRRRFGPDMEQLFADRLREVDDRRAAARLWTAAVFDLVTQAGHEWGARARTAVRALWVEGTRMDGWLQDLGFGARGLLRRPGFTAAAVGTLALGIGATVSIFTVVNAVLLRPLPHPDPEQLVVLRSVDTASGATGVTVDHPDVRLWQEQVPELRIAGYSATRPTLTGLGDPEVVDGVRVTDGLLTLLGYAPALGRDLVAADDVPGGPNVLLVSHAFWSERLGRGPDVLGTSVTLGGEPWEIVGVAPPGFDFPGGTQLWMPRHHETDGCGHGCRLLRAIGRRAADASLEEVQARLDVVAARLAEDFPDAHRDDRAVLVPMLEDQVDDVRAGLWILFGAVGMVLLIACANVANLMLVRASQRLGEVGLRRSLGASRLRIVRQLLTESLMLAVLAGALGLALSAWGTATLVRLAPTSVPRLGDASPDLPVLVFTGVLVVVVTSLFGLAPALHLSGSELRAHVASGTRSVGRRRAGTSRALLLCTEVALSLALLLGAGLLFRTLLEVRGVEYGFRVEAAERFRVSIPESRYDSLGVVRFLDELETRLGEVPGVSAAGIGFGVPLTSSNISTSIRLLDRPPVEPADRPSMSIRPSSPGLLEASGMRLVAGRWFTADDRYGSEGVAVLNETAARRFYPGMDPIGRRIGADVSWGFADTPDLAIVGVVADVRTRSATEEPVAALYLPNAQFAANSVYVWLRLQPGVRTALPEARGVLAELDPELAVTDAGALEEAVAGQEDAPRFYLTLLAVFSALALVLAVIGLYGVVAYSVSQRKREIGIRIALGADGERVVRMVVRQGLRPAVAGVGVGLVLSLAGARALESLLFGVEPTDPVTIAAVSSFLLLVAAAATLLPARRASRIPAAEALRTD